MIALVAMSGCGGSSSSSGGAEGPVTVVEPPPEDLSGRDQALRGTLWLERRGDKLVADAWFRADDASASEAAALDTCKLDVLSAETSSPAEAPLRMPAARIALESREGEQLALVSQRLGAAVVYASEQRWLREPIADDTRVVVRDGAGESLFDSIALSAVPDATLESPATRRLRAVAEPVRWNGVAGADTHVQIAVTGQVGGIDRRVLCHVTDDGEFNLPADLLDGAIGTSGMTVSLARERRRTTVRGDDRFEVVQRVLF